MVLTRSPRHEILVHFIGVEMEKSSSLLRGMECSKLMLMNREVRIWDVKKLQIQSDLFLPSSQDIQGVAVDGHRGIIYTLTAAGVSSPTDLTDLYKVEKHLIPTKPT